MSAVSSAADVEHIAFFHHVDRAGSAAIIERAQDGDYLLRPSSVSNAFSLDVRHEGKQLCLLVACVPSGGFCIRSGGSSAEADKVFATIQDLVAANSSVLRRPIPASSGS